MFLAAFLIGLREGLEASLIIGILIAYVTRVRRADVRSKIWLGVGLAVGLSVGLGALFAFGRYQLTFQGQEIIGGSLSLVAVAMVSVMVLWMVTQGKNMKASLESEMGTALLAGTGWAIFWVAFVTVGREGLETTLLLWGWLTTPMAISGALLGLLTAVGLGYAIFKGAVRINFSSFFAWMGGFLIIVAAGILAYGIHDLQEAAVLPGPFSGAPITPTDVRTGEVLTGFTDNPFWFAAIPFGWAFNYSDVIDPTGFVATLLKGTVGFTPQMSWLEVIAWFLYMVIVFPMFIRRVRGPRLGKRRAHPAGSEPPSATTTSDQPSIANQPDRDAGGAGAAAGGAVVARESEPVTVSGSAG